MNNKSPTFPKQAAIAIGVSMPMAYGLNIPLDTVGSSIPLWGIILINAVVVTTYMTFMVPRAIRFVFLRLTKQQEVK